MKKLEIDRRVASLVWLLVERLAPLPQNNTTLHLRAVDAVIDQLEPFVTAGGGHPIAAAKAAPAPETGEPKDDWHLAYDPGEPFTLALEDAHFDMVAEMWKGQGGQHMRNIARPHRWKRQICFAFDAAMERAKG